MKQTRQNAAQSGEEGFMLVGAIVLVFLVLLMLSIAAPKVARALRRDQEVEAIHRGNEYVRAIQLYYRKNGHYPGSMEQLEKSNNIRYLRQKYTDPMTGKADWRLIHQGEAKTTVKGFFGQPLAGLPGNSGGLGSAASMVSSNQGTASTVGGSTSSPMGSSLGSGSSGSGFSLGSSSLSSSPSTTGTGSTSGSTAPGTTVSSSTSTSSGVSSQSATGFTGSGGAIVGIGSSKAGDSISILNEQKTYQTWEFLYDPRIEQLKAKAALMSGAQSTGLGSSSGSSSSSGFGTSSFGNSGLGGTSSGSGTTTPPTTTPPATNPQ